MSSAGFRPSLVGRLLKEKIAVMEKWGMDDRAVPVDSDHKRDLAIWKGAFTDADVAPVIAVSVERGMPIDYVTTLWFGGIASKELVELSQDSLVAYADAATFQAEDLSGAITLVGDLMDAASLTKSSGQ